MSPKRESIAIRIDLIPGEGGTKWGWCYSMEGSGGCGPGGDDQLTAMHKAARAVRKELRRLMETKDEKRARLEKAKRVAALRKSKDEGTLNA